MKLKDLFNSGARYLKFEDFLMKLDEDDHIVICDEHGIEDEEDFMIFSFYDLFIRDDWSEFTPIAVPTATAGKTMNLWYPTTDPCGEIASVPTLEIEPAPKLSPLAAWLPWATPSIAVEMPESLYSWGIDWAHTGKESGEEPVDLSFAEPEPDEPKASRIDYDLMLLGRKLK